MQSRDRSATVAALVLIGLGALFLAFNLIPGLNIGQTWPIIFILIAGAFYLPAIVWPSERKSLAGLYIPGSIMLVLGLIFFFNTITSDWGSWAYIWTLIPGSVGLGLALASRIGAWGRGTTQVGIWMMVGSAVAFGFFGLFFGGALVRTMGPVLLILCGALLLLGALRRPAR